MKKRLNRAFLAHTGETEKKMNGDKIRQMLVEREDSILNNWNKGIKEIGVNNKDMVGVDTFVRIYKMFRLDQK